MTWLIPDATGHKAVFSFSIRGELLGFLFFSFIIGYTVIYDANEYLHGALAGGLPSLYFVIMLESFSLFVLAIDLSTRERTVAFFDDSLKIKGRKTNLEIPYSEVTEVSLERVKWFWLPFRYRGVSLAVKGHLEPFRIPSNPKNGNLKIDLYSWLLKKVQRPLPSS